MFFGIIPLTLVAICTAVRYDNYTLFRVIPSKNSQVLFLRSLEQNGFVVNFWSEPGLLGKPVEFSIAPNNNTLFLKQTRKLQMPVIVMQDNIQRLFDEEKKNFFVRTNNVAYSWEDYFGLDDIYAWLKDLAKTRAPEILVHKIGRTHENREILAAIVLLKGCLRRSKVIVEGGIHAREWIAPAFVTYMIDKILNAPHSNDDELKKIAMTYEWYFIPILNPDGYEYTHKTDRMWIKNRNGPGVNLNRNFAYKFELENNTKPGDDTWCGENAFSENETLALRNFVKYIGEGVEYYFSFHSYGQYMIIPYAYTKEYLDNYHVVKKLALKAADVIKSVHNTVYHVGTSSETVGKARKVYITDPDYSKI